jgi:DNA invertase Pin-like site-specific DNA recombinase
VRRYLLSHHGEQIAEFVEVESGKRSDRPQLAAAMALAKRRKATMLVAKLDRLSRSVAFISAVMDSRGFKSRHCRYARRESLAAAEHERHMIGERTRHALAADKARGIKLANPKQAEINRAKAAEQAQSLAPAHRALHRGWPHVEQCDRSRSQRARHRGTEWRSMVSDAG